MKSKYFVVGVVAACLVIGFMIYFFLFGMPSNFHDPSVKTEPNGLMGTVYTGGPLVAILVSLTLMVVTFIIERLFALARAQGRGNLPQFLRRVHDQLLAGNVTAAIEECNKQRGSAANILRAGLER